MIAQKLFSECDTDKVTDLINELSDKSYEKYFIRGIIAETLYLKPKISNEIELYFYDCIDVEVPWLLGVCCKIYGDDENYDISLVPRREQIGYNVSKDNIRKYDINQLVASLLWEMTFYGWNANRQEENVEKETKELIELSNGIKNGTAKTYSWDEIKEEFNNKYGN